MRPYAVICCQASFPLANVSGAYTQSAAGHVAGKLQITM